MKKNTLILFLILLVPTIIILFRLFINVVNFISISFFPDSEKDVWKKQTSPLSKEQVKKLCDNLNLNQETICNQEYVYGPEFYSYIVNEFHPAEEFNPYKPGLQPATFTDVENKIGYFKVDCGPIVTGSIIPGKEFQYFTCHYDLRGDGKNILGIFFRVPEKQVIRITRPLSSED